MLILSRKKNESIIIDDNIEIVVTDIEEGKVKIGINAPKNIDIHRKEVHKLIKESNKEAAKSDKVDLGSLGELFKK